MFVECLMDLLVLMCSSLLGVAPCLYLAPLIPIRIVFIILVWFLICSSPSWYSVLLTARRTKLFNACSTYQVLSWFSFTNNIYYTFCFDLFPIGCHCSSLTTTFLHWHRSTLSCVILWVGFPRSGTLPLCWCSTRPLPSLVLLASSLLHLGSVEAAGHQERGGVALVLVTGNEITARRFICQHTVTVQVVQRFKCQPLTSVVRDTFKKHFELSKTTFICRGNNEAVWSPGWKPL